MPSKGEHIQFLMQNRERLCWCIMVHADTANCTIIDQFPAFESGLVALFLYAAG